MCLVLMRLLTKRIQLPLTTQKNDGDILFQRIHCQLIANISKTNVSCV